MQKSRLPMITLICTTLCLAGCVTDSKISATFNPKAVYQIAPEGVVLEDLIDMGTTSRVGRIYIPAGSIVHYDAELVDGKL